MPTAAPPHVRRLASPAPARVLATDVYSVALFLVAVTVGLWLANGGWSTLTTGGVDSLSGIGQITGLLAALAALGGLILSSRPRFLERRFGLDQMLHAHRWFGISTVFLVLVHAIADTWAWGAASGGSIISGLLDLIANEPWMLAATVSFLIFLTIGISSYRRIRQALSYETWYYLHLTGYLAVVLAFGHQLTAGTDIVTDPLMRIWWIAIAVGATAIILWARIGDLIRSLGRRLHITGIWPEADGVASIHIGGPGLRKLKAEGGQFFMLRILTKDLWWQAHPFSLSAAPTNTYLRFTVKELGSDTANMLKTRPGTRVLLEGPYGVFTAAQAEGNKVLLVAGGIGAAPIRAILEDCSPAQEPVVIYRARNEADLAHAREIESICADRNGHMIVLTGRREIYGDQDPFRARALRTLVPDISSRHVFVCGPASMESAVVAGARSSGVAPRAIHRERFGV